MNLDDIKILFEHTDITIQSKRIPEEPEDANLRRFKDKWLFITTLILIILSGYTCILFIIMNHWNSSSGIALNGIIGLTMALGGYYVRGRNN